MRARTLALLLLMLTVSTTTPAAAADADPLPGIVQAHAKRLTEYAAWLKDQHLGSIAVRVFEDALAIDPEQVAAGQALDWVRDSNGWKPRDPRVIAGQGWADDGEANLGVAARREAALNAQHVKECLDAATTLRAKKAAPEIVERVLWAAVAADPAAVAPRQALKHRENGGRWLAPEHESVAAAMAADATAREALRAAPTAAATVDPPWPTLSGWRGPVPKGARSAAGVVVSLTDPAWALEGAAWRERAQRLVAELFAPPLAGVAAKPPLYPLLHVSRREVLNAFVDDVKGATREQKDYWKTFTEWRMTSVAAYLHYATSPAEWFDAIVRSDVEASITNALGGFDGVDWLRRGLAYAATRRALGTNLGWVSHTNAVYGQTGAWLRRGESLDGFVRRMVSERIDPPLESVTGMTLAQMLPRDIAKAGSVLEWLFHRDAAKAQDFVRACRGVSSGGGPATASVESAVEGAGFGSLSQLEEAWRRFVIDTAPAAPYAAAGGEPWKVTRLERAKGPPDATSLYEPVVHPVVKYILLGGHGYLCEPADGGKSVRLESMTYGGTPRVVSDPGVYPFSLPGEYGAGHIEVHVALSRDERGSWRMRTADAVTGNLAGAALQFVDVDLDGRPGSFFHDGYAVSGGALLQPLRPEIVLGSKIVTIRRVGPDGKEVAWRARPLPVKGGDLEGLLRLNFWRIAAGVAAVAWDEGEAPGSQLHADYLARNFADGAPPDEMHREDLAKPGATATGALAAARAVVVAAPSQAAAVDRWMADLKARAALLDPAARRAAGGFSKNVAVLFLTGPDADDPAETFLGPVSFPPPSADGVPTARAAGADSAAGFPISLHFASGTAPETAISVRTAAGAVVERAAAETEGAMPPGVAAFVPKSPLAAGTAYRVSASWESGGIRDVREWTFRTGPK